MAYQFFIEPLDCKRESVLDGNIDDDLLLQYMKFGHDIHVRNLMGEDLFDRFQAGLTAADLTTGTDSETDLLNNFIKQMTIHWCLVEIFSFLPYTASSKGVFKHLSESAEVNSKEENDALVEKHRDIAQHYSRRFVEYMKFNSSSFAEYTSNTDEETKPSTSTDFGGWVL